MTLDEMKLLARSIGVERLTTSRLVSGVPVLLYGVTLTAGEQPTVEVLTGTDPAAGAELSQTVPSGERWKLLTLWARLVTSVTAADRYPRLVVDDGTNWLWITDPSAAHTANTAMSYTVGAGQPRQADVYAARVWAYPEDLWLLPGYRLRTDTPSLQAGDDWEAPQLLLAKWVYPRNGVNLYDGSNSQGELKLSLRVPAGESRVLRYDPPLFFRQGLYASLGGEIAALTLQTALFRE